MKESVIHNFWKKMTYEYRNASMMPCEEQLREVLHLPKCKEDSYRENDTDEEDSEDENSKSNNEKKK